MVTSADLLGRILIIERDEASKYADEPAIPLNEISADNAKPSEPVEVTAAGVTGETNVTDAADASDQTVSPDEAEPLSLLQSLWKLMRSPRAIAVLLSTLIYG